MRGDYERAADALTRAADVYGTYGRQTSKWFEWSVRVIRARLSARQGRAEEALALADAIVAADGAPPAERLDAELIAAEALLLAERTAGAAARIAAAEGRIDPRVTPGPWGEFLRLRGQLHAREGRPNEAYHDIAQSASVFDLVGERYQAAVGQLALGHLAQDAGARSIAERHFVEARDVFRALGSPATSTRAPALWRRR